MAFAVCRFSFFHRDQLISALFLSCCLLGSAVGSIEIKTGSALFLLGSGLRLVILRQFGDRVFGVKSLDMVCDGAFSVVRNPIYLANICAVTGLTIVFAGTVAGLVSLFFSALVSHLCVLWEERQIEAQGNDRYLKYLSNVPRWVPNFSLYEKADVRRQQGWSDVFRIERFSYRKLLILVSIVILIRFFG